MKNGKEWKQLQSPFGNCTSSKLLQTKNWQCMFLKVLGLSMKAFSCKKLVSCQTSSLTLIFCFFIGIISSIGLESFINSQRELEYFNWAIKVFCFKVIQKTKFKEMHFWLLKIFDPVQIYFSKLVSFCYEIQNLSAYPIEQEVSFNSLSILTKDIQKNLTSFHALQ